MPFHVNIIERARSNTDYRRELFTAPHSQLVLMNLVPGVEIGAEVHTDIDQIIVFVQGTGQAVIDGQTSSIAAGDLYVVPAGTRHNFINTGTTDLKLYTINAPEEHAPGTVHTTKNE